ncbi:MAG TPA: ferrous iron transporter B, partial [Dehalococcoidia bacterium]|nr:ferrous iron transporter B [Dehalococcoidia bacterium]
MPDEEILKARDESLAHLKSIYRDDAETIIADARYGFISGLLKDVLSKPPVEQLTLSDKIDRILVNRWLGIPLLLLVIFALFQFVFALSSPLMDWISQFFDWLADFAIGVSPEWLGSLLANGVLGGVGTVLTFIPPIFLMFIAIS